MRRAVWLPVQYSFSRNDTVAAIKSGKYTNIRGMFSPSATTPTTGKWQTAQQAIADGNETTPTYSLFDMGALCWYFAQELVERGVKTPIGIADTAIGGQRIEEFLVNKSYVGEIRCPDAVGADGPCAAENACCFCVRGHFFSDENRSFAKTGTRHT